MTAWKQRSTLLVPRRRFPSSANLPAVSTVEPFPPRPPPLGGLTPNQNTTPAPLGRFPSSATPAASPIRCLLLPPDPPPRRGYRPNQNTTPSARRFPSSARPFWRHLGAILVPLGVPLGPSWGRPGAILGPSWCHVGAILGPSWDTSMAPLKKRRFFQRIPTLLGEIRQPSARPDPGLSPPRPPPPCK